MKVKVLILCINCTSLQYVLAGQIGAAAEFQGPEMDCFFTMETFLVFNVEPMV